MQTTIVKWGNSHGVRLPKAFLKNMNISENDPVSITLENEKIVIEKIIAKEHKTLKQRLSEFYGENYEHFVEPQREYDWGKSVGKEI